MSTVIGVNGACGRMGQRIVALAIEDKDIAIGAALENAGHLRLGQDIGEVVGIGKLGVLVTAMIGTDRKIDAMIDFSLPEGTMTVLPICRERRIPLVVATTGHTAAQVKEIEAAARDIPLLMAPNV